MALAWRNKGNGGLKVKKEKEQWERQRNKGREKRSKEEKNEPIKMVITLAKRMN